MVKQIPNPCSRLIAERLAEQEADTVPCPPKEPKKTEQNKLDNKTIKE
jgi:hypothetical protein